MHASDLPGIPDFVFDEARLVVFVDGCFWHGCPHCGRGTPKTNRDYWTEKIASNMRRDRSNARKLRALGWRVTRIWEHELKGNLAVALARVARRLS